MDPISTVCVAAVAGVAANFLFEKLKKLLKQRHGSKVSVTLPSGRVYDIPAHPEDREELEQAVRSLLYSTDASPEVHPAALDVLEDVVTPTYKLLLQRARDTGIQLQVSVPQNLPQLSGDKIALQVLLFNVLTNALKYSMKGSTVTVRANRGADVLELQIANPSQLTGEPQEVEHIFELGFRGNETALRDRSGMGMGLFVAKRIAQAHGGDIAVESRPGMFVTKIEIPLAAGAKGTTKDGPTTPCN